MEICKLKLKDGTELEGVIKSPSYMGHNHNLGDFFGFFVDGRLQLAVAESEVAKIFYENSENNHAIETE
jgi:hypothetical protein